jgi:cytochrome o ubiquinol oxidase subunit 2
MKAKYKIAIFAVILLGAVTLLVYFLHSHEITIFNPKGAISIQERNLIIIATFLMLIVVIPAYTMLFTFARKYRAGNEKAKYAPDLDNNKVAGLIWAAPTLIILMIAVINWKSTHALDPYKPIESAVKPLTIQVVALQWKWLFIYPEQNIATVNFIEFPERTPLNFELTADAPMNSFWIPQLGGQMYAMAGMRTQLHLIANEIGEFRGSAAEINGNGFAGMHFIAKAASQADFDAWVASIKKSPAVLTQDEYNKLAQPSEDNLKLVYASVEKNLYNSVMAKFMAPTQNTRPTSTPMPKMQNMGM